MPTYFGPEGLSVRFEETNPTGDPTVVLLHGLGSAGEAWQLQFDPVASLGFRVVAPDIPGFGWSPWPGGPVSISRFAQMMAHFIQGIGAAPAHVAGISMGGTIALQLALDHPQLVRSLVLVNTFARLRPRSLSERLYFLVRLALTHLLGPERQAELVARRIFPHPHQEELRAVLKRHIRQADPKVYRGALRALWRFDVEERLEAIRVPTLVITGEEDTTVPPPVQEILAKRIPGARHVRIPGAGHGVIADSPDAFNEALISFYRELQSG